MSHLSTIETAICDVQALEAAVRALGLEWVVHGEGRLFYGKLEKAGFVVKLPGPYDLLVDLPAVRGGTLKLQCDRWNGHVERVLGKNLGLLVQAYNKEKITMAMRMKSRTTRSRVLSGGVIEMIVGGG